MQVQFDNITANKVDFSDLKDGELFRWIEANIQNNKYTTVLCMKVEIKHTSASSNQVGYMYLGGDFTGQVFRTNCTGAVERYQQLTALKVRRIQD